MLLDQLKARCAQRPDTEHEQALVRVGLGLGVFVYVAIAHWGLQPPLVSGAVVHAVTLYVAGAVTILVAAVAARECSLWRRAAGMALDIGLMTYAMIIGGEMIAFFYGGYLWVIIANGLRYGRGYLYASSGASLVAFALVLWLSPFWQQHIVLGFGLMAWIILLPLYAAKLISSLEGAIAKADAANQSKSQFLANMSHEIRTPLTAIIGFAEAALESDQTMEERLAGLKTIVSSGRHLLQIINDILDFSKIEAGHLELEQLEFSLVELLIDVERLAGIRAREKGLAFQVSYQFPIPERIICDPTRLKQVLINLCSNAVKFTESGHVQIRVRCDGQGERLHFAVVDSGIGMTQEQMGRLFQRFAQADPSTTRKYGGTGLGLVLTRQLVERLGGTLRLSSQHGIGSCFEFDLPMGPLSEVRMLEDAGQLPRVRHEAAPIVTTKRLGGRILLAEDTPANQRLLTLYLGKMGPEVTVVENGQQAVDAAYAHGYDLIFMDMQMPVMDGLEAVAELRARGYTRPIVALTANAYREDRERYQQAGCDEVVIKPVSRSELYQVAARYLKVNASDQQALGPIHSTLMDEEPELVDLVVRFVDELPRRLAELSDAIAAQQWDAARSITHKLKGAGGGFGYQMLSEVAGKMDFQLANQDYAQLNRLLNELNSLVSRIYAGRPSEAPPSTS